MSNLGGWAIGIELFNWVRDNIESGSDVLEFGSGNGTKELVKHFNVTSVEHNSKWLNNADSNYIHAPIVDNWYDVSKLDGILDNKYELILIDGPTGNIGRCKILDFYLANTKLFDSSIIIIDDTERPDERKIVNEFVKYGFKSIYSSIDPNKSFEILKK